MISKRKRVLKMALTMLVVMLLACVACLGHVCAVNAADGTYIWPVDTSIPITAGWYYSSGSLHGATDFGCGVGTPVYASADGVVTSVVDRGCQGSHQAGGSPACPLGSSCAAVTASGKSHGSYGNWIVIRHDDGMYTYYCHLSTGQMQVAQGQSVSQGQLIGYSGVAGNATGPHLHFEMRPNNSYDNRVDPQDYLTKTNAPSANHEVSSVYARDFAAIAKETFVPWNVSHVAQSGRRIDAGDACTIHEVYTDGCCKVTYPSSSSSTGYVTLYGKFTSFDVVDLNKDSLIFWGFTNKDNSSCGIEANATPTIAGELKFWFKKTIADTNHYCNIYLDNKLVGDHILADSNGYITYVVNSVNMSDGNHTLRADLYHTNGLWQVEKAFKVSNYRPVVTFNANGGSCSTGTKTVVYTGTYGTLPTPTKNGYTFTGWYTAASGGTKVTDTTKVTSKTNHTLYAVWKANTYTMYFAGNGGSGVPSSMTRVYGQNVTFPTTVPTKKGYVFKGWLYVGAGKDEKATTTATSGTYMAGATAQNEGNPGNICWTPNDATYVATWAPATYKVYFAGNGGSNLPSSFTRTYGQNVTFPTTVPTKKGYVFKGWLYVGAGKDEKATTTATSGTYMAGATAQNEGNPSNICWTANDATYVATWAPATYKVYFAGNGGSNLPSSFTRTYGQNVTFPTTVPTKKGYVFKGWVYAGAGKNENATTMDTSGKYLAGATAKNDGDPNNICWTANDSTYVATWAPATYKVYFAGNGGSNLPSSFTRTYGQNVTFPTTVPTKEGYTFKGWVYAGAGKIEDATTTATTGYYMAGATAKNDGDPNNICWTANDATYVATWEANAPEKTDDFPFTDVKMGGWQESAVRYMLENKIMSGKTATTFDPNTAMNRGQLVAVLWNMEGKPKVTGTMPFSDVASTNTFYNAILWASKNNIVNGFASGEFKPKNELTREQIAAILMNYSKYKGITITNRADLSKYEDAAKVGTKMVTAMQWAVGNKIISGKNNGTLLDPKGSATRIQVAAMVMSYCENLK